MGLEVHAGHGLTYDSAKILSKISGIQEFNIGHFLIGESIFVGTSGSVSDAPAGKRSKLSTNKRI